MKKINNVGTGDRDIRVVLGIIFLIAGIFFATNPILMVVLLVLAGVMFATAFAGFCPLYSLANINTNKDADKITQHK